MPDDDLLNLEFGAHLRRLRSEAELTQEELAEAARLSRPSIVNIEAGRQGVTLATLYRLADALGLEPGQLLPALNAIEAPPIAIGVRDNRASSALIRVLRRAGESAI